MDGQEQREQARSSKTREGARGPRTAQPSAGRGTNTSGQAKQQLSGAEQPSAGVSRSNTRRPRKVLARVAEVEEVLNVTATSRNEPARVHVGQPWAAQATLHSTVPRHAVSSRGKRAMHLVIFTFRAVDQQGIGGTLTIRSGAAPRPAV